MHACLTRQEFDSLAKPFIPILTNIATKYVGPDDAPDRTSDALSFAWQQRSNYDPGTGTDGFRNWLKHILSTICVYSLCDKRERDDELSLDEALAYYDTPDALGSEDRLLALVADYLRRHLHRLALTERQYDCLGLRLNGYSGPEIASHLGIRQQTVSLHIQAAIQKARRDRTLHYWMRFFVWCSQVTIYRAPTGRVWNKRTRRYETYVRGGVRLEAYDEENTAWR